jgi:hypothetical protein
MEGKKIICKQECGISVSLNSSLISLGLSSVFVCIENTVNNFRYNKQTPWSESASELYRPSDRRLSAK